MRISGLHKIIIAVLAYLLLYFAVIFLVIEPLWHQVLSYSRNVLLQKSALKLLQDQFIALQGFKKNYTAYQEQFQKIANGFVNPYVPIDFIRYLEATADNNNLDISPSLSGAIPAGRAAKDGWQPIGFQVRLSGNIQGGFRFIEQLERGPRFLELKQLSIKKEIPQDNSPDPQNQNALFNISLNAFSYHATSTGRK
jgi:hypothetical protein